MEILFAVLSIFVCTSFANLVGLIRQRRQETDCQMRYRINEPDWTKPVCNYDGSYRPYQCEVYSQYKCWCVYDNGMMIPDSAQDLKGVPAKEYKKLKCAEKKATAPAAPDPPPIRIPFTSRRLGWHLAYRNAANQAKMCPSNCPSPCSCTPGQMYYPYAAYNNYDPYTSQMQQYGCPQPCPQPCPCQQPSSPPTPPPPPPPPPPAPIMSYPSPYQQMTPYPAACPVPCPAPCFCQQDGFPSPQTQAMTPSQPDQAPQPKKSQDDVSDAALGEEVDTTKGFYTDNDADAYNSYGAARDGVSKVESDDESGSGNNDDSDDDDSDEDDEDDGDDGDDGDSGNNNNDREEASGN